jgi:hypothetical protein
MIQQKENEAVGFKKQVPLSGHSSQFFNSFALQALLCFIDLKIRFHSSGEAPPHPF